MKKPSYITRLDQVPQLSEKEREALKPVNDKFVFRTNDYYQGLIDWKDPDDPIRKIVIPDVDELKPWGELDASNESKYTVVPGCEHKYTTTALLLVNDVCGAYCRFCFRKRLFIDDNDEVTRDISEGLAYIRAHPEINNVLLTGGDPLLMSTRRLDEILGQLREIPHVRIIRIGSKLPVFNPYRITEDPSLLETLSKYTSPDSRIYIMVHFNHPRELTDIARKGLDLLRQAGVSLTNQTPLIKGVNDKPEVLAELLNELSYIGVPPYYIFQCRPTEGNKPFTIPIEKSWEIVQQALLNCSGLARRVRLAMSHESGKIEIVGQTQQHMFFRYHSCADHERTGEFMVFKRNPEAYWFDDYSEVVESYAPQAEAKDTVLGNGSNGNSHLAKDEATDYRELARRRNHNEAHKRLNNGRKLPTSPLRARLSEETRQR